MTNSVQVTAASGGVAAILDALDPALSLVVAPERVDVVLGLVFARELGRPLPRAVVVTGSLPDDVIALWNSRVPDVPLVCTEAAIHEFEHEVLASAKRANRHVVLPEGTEPRVLKAAAHLLARGIVRLTLLGNAADVAATASEHGLDVSAATVIDPETDALRRRFADEYAELRKAKGVTPEQAFERMADVSYFGTMMVADGLADGMVSGAVHTTAHTIRPAFEIIKTAPGVSVVSSVFFMCLPDKVLAFGDCAVNPNPTPEQLAQIAVTSARTAKQFGIEPRVALLSYSTGTSGSGPDVDRVVEGTRLAQALDPSLAIDGPMQLDAAIVPEVARTKAPNSAVAGRATVLIFPSLDAGNIAYKAVQRTAGALAIGPVLQGLNKPINDLSRGATVPDIINTVAITALQAV